jgi:hypothetical protein
MRQRARILNRTSEWGDSLPPAAPITYAMTMTFTNEGTRRWTVGETATHPWPMLNGLSDFLTITEHAAGTRQDGTPTLPVLWVMEQHGRAMFPIYADDAAWLGQALMDFAVDARAEAERAGRSAHPDRCPRCGRPGAKCRRCPPVTCLDAQRAPPGEREPA